MARAIDHEMKRLGLDCVTSNSHRERSFLQTHFLLFLIAAWPWVSISALTEPVVLAAHFTCGGVVVDQHGASDLPGRTWW